MGTKLSFFIHYPKMMLGFSSNSAERRQKCTTTIRSCRAHPRRVLDTAALNAYVPDYVGSKSKSHSELTWNHVVAVFTFFGLLMTALMSLCCWSHFQFSVERRRLALKKNVTVTNSPDSDFNLTYDLTDKDADIPKWFKDDPKAVMNTSKQIHIFGGSNPIKNETWTAHAGRCSTGDKCTKKSKYLKDSSYNKSTKACECGEAWVTKWYISTDKEHVIFFDQVQKKVAHGWKERPNVSQPFEEFWRSAP